MMLSANESVKWRFFVMQMYLQRQSGPTCQKPKPERWPAVIDARKKVFSLLTLLNERPALQ
jgi:hypothetical protein